MPNLQPTLIGPRITIRPIAEADWSQMFTAGSDPEVWAVHPVATEAVSNIVGRADLLAALGSLAALFAYIKARDSDGSRRCPAPCRARKATR